MNVPNPYAEIRVTIWCLALHIVQILNACNYFSELSYYILAHPSVED